MKYAIVTGASRGLGLETAKNLIRQGFNVVTLSRKDPDLSHFANDKVITKHFEVDLTNLEELKNVLVAIVGYLKEQTVNELIVVNNAGMVTPIGPVGTLNNEEIVRHVTLNVTALMVITNTIKKEFDCELMVINVTSGAAERSVYGWNVYCSTKASVNMFTQTSALEAIENNTNDLHIAFSPGIMDTVMQEEIRSTNSDDFKEVEQFKNYKKEGKLRSPKEVADLLIGLIDQKSELENGKVYRVYDLVK